MGGVALRDSLSADSPWSLRCTGRLTTLIAPCVVQFAIDLICGTFYSLVSFTLFERVRLRKLDRAHYANGLTNGYERLFFARRDGDNWTEYGERMLRRLGPGAGADGEADGEGEGKVALSRSTTSSANASAGSSPAGSSRGAAAARREGGYVSLPADRQSEDLSLIHI